MVDDFSTRFYPFFLLFCSYKMPERFEVAARNTKLPFTTIGVLHRAVSTCATQCYTTLGITAHGNYSKQHEKKYLFHELFVELELIILGQYFFTLFHI